jgi:hypothetical protein
LDEKSSQKILRDACVIPERQQMAKKKAPVRKEQGLCMSVQI